MERIACGKKELKKFAITMAIACLIIAVLIFIKHKHINLVLFVVSAVFFGFALIAPNLLKPVYLFWMKLALILGWINTRLILLLVFYLCFTPMGFILRLLKKDLLDRPIDTAKPSYWKAKERKVSNPLDYERLF